MKTDTATAYEAIFVGVLGRKPRPDELAAWMNNNGVVTPLNSLAESLRKTDEYYDNLALKSEQMVRSANGRKVFFLHIPKSGGISVRTTMRQKLGNIPPLIFSVSPFLHAVEPGPSSWPFLTGHVGIDAAPPEYSCVTVFREPRSRILSLHRFVASRHFENWLSHFDAASEVSRKWRESSIRSIVEASSLSHLWSGFMGETYRLTFAWMFADGFSTYAKFSELSATERRSAIRRGLRRVSHAAWIHDGPGLARMIGNATGREPGGTRRMNVTDPTLPDSPTVIDRKTRKLLTDFVEDDVQVQELASSAGLIEPLSVEKRDELFRETAIKLGYVYE